MSKLLNDVCEALKDPRLEWVVNKDNEIGASQIRAYVRDPKTGNLHRFCPITGMYWLRTGEYLDVLSAVIAVKRLEADGTLPYISSTPMIVAIMRAADNNTNNRRLRSAMLKALNERPSASGEK